MTRIITWDDKTTCIGPAAIAIGVFDGVHVGHQTLVRDTVEFAAALDAASAVVTFDRDPDRVVAPGSAAPQLLNVEDKLDLLGELGADHLLVVPFDAHVAAMTPERFLHDVLLATFMPVATVVGHDFRFGTRASGDVTTLERYGAEHAFTVIAHELVSVDGAPVTSTRIRAAIAAGDMRLAAHLLGRPHRLRGRVAHGRGEGATVLGVPTANLSLHPWSASPAAGVYAAFAHVAGQRFRAAVSVGIPPTFPDAHHAVEAHLIGFEGTLYGEEVVLEFIERIGLQERLETTGSLAEKIRRDIEVVSAVLDREAVDA